MASLPICIRSWQESLPGADVGNHWGGEGTQDFRLDQPTSVTMKTKVRKPQEGRTMKRVTNKLTASSSSLLRYKKATKEKGKL